MSDSVYLHDIPLDQAMDRLKNALMKAGINGILGVGQIPLRNRHGPDIGGACLG